MFYQTIHMITAEEAARGFRAFPEPPGPSVRLSQRSPQALPDSTISNRINQELSLISQGLERMVPPRGGALIEVVVFESKIANDAGKKGQQFVSMRIVNIGVDPALSVRVYQPKPGPAKRAPRGFGRKVMLIWATGE
jgi:hypothetical protein